MGGQPARCAWLKDGVGCHRLRAKGEPMHCAAHALEAAARVAARPAVEFSGAGAGSATTDQGKASGGAKHDGGKLGTHLLPTRPLMAVARVLDFGAKKYAPNNWRRGIAYTRVYGAVLRHIWAWWQGEAIDAETQEPHLACAACELLFLLEYELGDSSRRTACDDRPEVGAEGAPE